MDVAKRHQDKLSSIKKNVKNAYDYFKPNYDRYNKFRRFIFESSLREEDITLLMTLSKPQLEFNVLEAYISRLLGEFSKQEPDIEVSSDDPSKADPLIISILEQHLRHVLCDSNNDHTRYEVYKDLLSGGFSVLKVFTDYSKSMPLDQVIEIKRAFDPTLCGFDQVTQYSHKGDGRFCFEIFPKTKEDFEEENPDVSLVDMNFRRDFSGFNWSYLNDMSKIVIVCDYYEKKKQEVMMVKLVNGKVMKQKDYNNMLKSWGDLAAPPSIIGKRKVITESIDRYRCIENQVIEYVQTDFSYLPLIFVDGNSAVLKTPNNGNIRQFTRPYVYHAEGAQRLKNYAGIELANQIENTMQHKFIVAKEALPKEQELSQAYKDVQKASVVVFNSVHENNPDMPISNPIREVQHIPMPPEISTAITITDQIIQNELGSYDASLGINNNQLSGIAIIEAASQSNATAMPYIVGYLQGYQRAAQIYVDLFPKYYTTPRSIPVRDNEGKKSFVKINQQDGVNMFYDANDFNVIVKAGASFQVQKSRTLMMVKEMMGMSPLFAQFISEKGINFILDNMEGKGVDQLKMLVESWQKEMEQQKQMAMQQQQQQMQNNPAIMKAHNDQMKLQLDAQKAQGQFTIDMAKLKADEQKVLMDAKLANQGQLVQVIKANTERFSKEVDLDLKHKDMGHRHAKEYIETNHKVNQSKNGII